MTATAQRPNVFERSKQLAASMTNDALVEWASGGMDKRFLRALGDTDTARLVLSASHGAVKAEMVHRMVSTSREHRVSLEAAEKIASALTDLWIEAGMPDGGTPTADAMGEADELVSKLKKQAMQDFIDAVNYRKTA